MKQSKGSTRQYGLLSPPLPYPHGCLPLLSRGEVRCAHLLLSSFGAGKDASNEWNLGLSFSTTAVTEKVVSTRSGKSAICGFSCPEVRLWH